MAARALTTPQRNIWDMQVFYEGSGISNINGLAFLDCEFDESLLTEIINGVFARHTAFHIRVRSTADGPVQCFEPPAPRTFETIDLSALASDEVRKKLEAIGSAEMPLLDTPLCTALFIRRASDWGMLLKLSHLVGDAWTLSLCIEQIIGAYVTAISGGTPEELASDYRAFIDSEERYLSSARYETDREFFMAQFEEPPRLLTFRKPEHRRSIEARRYTHELSAEASSRASEYCTTHSISPALLFEAALFIYLHRYFEESDITVGLPVLNRSGATEKATMGMFISTVPMTVRLEEAMSASELIGALGRSHFKLFRHQRFPYAELIEAVRERHEGVDALFDVSVSYQNARARVENGETGFTAEWMFHGYSENCLVVHITDVLDSGMFALHLDYLVDVFDETGIDLMRRRLLTIVDNIIADDSQTVSRIGIMDAEERLLVTEGFNHTDAEYDDSLTVVDLFMRAVEQWPERTALIFEDRSYTFRELDNITSQLAVRLIEMGSGRGITVGILTERSDWTVISMLAISKTGAAYMPLDIEYPIGRIEYLLDESDADIVVCYRSPHDLAETRRVVDLEVMELDTLSVRTLDVSIDPGDTHCVLHTSGSTGRPKGVRLAHRSFVNFYSTVQDLLSGVETVISLTALTFDVFRAETEFPLLTGRKCVIPSEAELQSFERLEELYSRYDRVMSFTVPAKLQHILSGGSSESAYGGVVRFLAGGEVFTRSLADLIRRRSPDAEIANGYGPAEATILCTTKVVDDGPITIGKPLPNYRVQIVDPHGEPVPIGFSGEIHISGVGVGQGYVDPDSPYRDRFIDTEPFPTYRTGDYGRWLPDGEIDFIGRKDGQVKLRGLRIELQEIETQIHAEAPVDIIKVLMREREGRQYLCAYYAARVPLDEKRLRHVLARTLPAYMIPHWFVRLDEFPISINGKMDLSELPEPHDEHRPDDTLEPLEGEAEHRIAQAFCEVLGLDDIGATDSFFEMGGDSLSAIRLLNLVNTATARQLMVREVFEHPTVRELAALAADAEAVMDAVGDLELGGIRVDTSSRGDDSRRALLLTGATGYLGAHVLRELITATDRAVHLIVRSEESMRTVFAHYFDYDLDAYADRVFIHQGDLTQADFGLGGDVLAALGSDVAMIIHCAANVRHYGRLEDSMPINVDATVALLEFAAAHDMRFGHVSTISVSGFGVVSQRRSSVTFDEESFDIGQRHEENVYVHTKYLAEQAVRAYAGAGLRTTILRMGNIGPRASDGRFQMNADENGFRSRRDAIARLGVIEQTLAAVPIEVSPVDVCARAVAALCLDGEDACYHVYNPHLRPAVRLLSEDGVDVRIVDSEEFFEALQANAHDEDVQLLHMYLTDLMRRGVTDIEDYGRGGNFISNERTSKILASMGIVWDEG